METQASRQDGRELENKIEEVYMCLDMMQSAMRLIGHKKNQSKKFKTSQYDHSKAEKFTRDLKSIKIKLSSAIRDLFDFLTDLGTYNKIASDFISNLQSTRELYHISDQSFKSVLKALLHPIILHLMDEEMISKQSKQRQDRRKHIITQLVNCTFKRVPSPNDEKPHEDSIEVIDICDTPPHTATTNNDHHIELNIPDNQMETISRMSVDTSTTIFIMEILFDALRKHTNTISRKDVDFFIEIYHIINVCYMVDLMGQLFDELRSRLRVDESQEDSAIEIISSDDLIKAMDHFESDLEGFLRKIDIESKFVIFRLDLRNLLLKIRSLKTKVNR